MQIGTWEAFWLSVASNEAHEYARVLERKYPPPIVGYSGYAVAVRNY